MSSGSSSLTHAAPTAPLLSFSPASADYPNHLATPEPERLRLPPAPWLLALLVLLCLAPRAVMALRVPSICCDGLTYVTTARALEAGNFRDALFEGAFNIYPAILVAVHRLGFDWETAAAVWGVAVSTLVILPLWGWARRQFDDRVALAACLLYIVHTTFIIESPEVMRDATFWFLFMLAIYWLWRAVTEVRYRYFMAGGAAITLALLTRIEGLFLLIPLVLWTFWRCLALRTGTQTIAPGRDVVRVRLSVAAGAGERGVAVRPLGLDDHPLESAGPRAAVAGVVFRPRHGRRWPGPRAADARRPDAFRFRSHARPRTDARVRAADAWRDVGMAAAFGPAATSRPCSTRPW